MYSAYMWMPIYGMPIYGLPDWAIPVATNPAAQTTFLCVTTVTAVTEYKPDKHELINDRCW
jgi:hypothetical protein